MGQVYRSSGGATGAWKDDVLALTARLDDVSAPSFVLIPVPVNSVISSIKAVLGGAITVANSSVTITRSGDGATVSTITVPFIGSAEGSVFNATLTANTALTASVNNYIKISTDGNSTTSAPLFFTIKLKVVE